MTARAELVADAEMEPWKLHLKRTAISIIRALHSLWQDKVATACAFWLLLILLCALFAPLISPHDYTQGQVTDRLKPPIWAEGSIPGYVLGTDQIGRDILSRLIWGARTSLIISLSVVALAGTFGTVMGLLAGYFGGQLDNVIMRWVDVQTAFPGLLLAMAIILMIGASVRNIIIVLSINGWMVYARMVRGTALAEKKSLYIEAARVIGANHKRIMFLHLLPNLLNPLITLANLEMARIVLAEAVLSFLGLGIQPPESSWGLMINDGHTYLPIGAWWLSILPGLCISFTVLAINLFATWLRSYTDPLQKTMMYRLRRLST